MKKLVGVLIIVFLISPVVFAGSMENDRAKISDMFKNAVYKNDPNIEILKFEYKPEGRSEGDFKGKVPTTIKEGWRTNIELKSLYTTKVKCDVSGKFILVNGKVDESAEEANLFNAFIEPKSTKMYTSGVIIDTKRLNKLKAFIIETICEPVQTLSQDDGDAKISNLLNNSSFKTDQGIKVVEFSFKKSGTEKYKDRDGKNKFIDIWKSNIKVQSCYTTKIECSGSGRFQKTDGDEDSSFWPVFPLGYIEKQAVVDKEGLIKVKKGDVENFTSFKIKINCNPVYSEHPPYAADDKYWKQFLPKNNECKNKR